MDLAWALPALQRPLVAVPSCRGSPEGPGGGGQVCCCGRWGSASVSSRTGARLSCPRLAGCPVRPLPGGAAALQLRSPWHGLCLRVGSGVSRARCPLPCHSEGGGGTHHDLSVCECVLRGVRGLEGPGPGPRRQTAGGGREGPAGRGDTVHNCVSMWIRLGGQGLSPQKESAQLGSLGWQGLLQAGVAGGRAGPGPSIRAGSPRWPQTRW